MADSISPIASSPFAGLGTAQFTIVNAGIYSATFKSFLPYLAAGGPAVSAQPVAEVQTVSTVADSAGSLNSTYFTFYDAGNAHGYYVWFNINSAGVDPAVSGLTGIAVAGATNASANTLATATRAAINAVSGIAVVASGATNAVIISNTYPGVTTAAANGGASPGFSYSVGTAGTFGTPAISGLVVQLKQNSTVLATYANPSPTQPIMSGSVSVACSAADVISFVFASQSTADAAPNALKSIVDVFQGIGG